MQNGSTKKTALEHSAIKVTPGPLPGTEPGAGALNFKLNWKAYSWAIRLGVIFVVLSGLFQAVTAQPTVAVGSQTFKVRVADESYEHVTGLSTTESLRPDEGMLFVLDEEQFLPIWMKDMKFAIDIVWLNADKQVINVHHNVTPDTYPKVYLPSDLALYVLEIPAGAADKAGVKDGETAKFNLGFNF